ncbi:MAG: AtpZ/AtpI family protein [Pedobacter sp.]|nr:AtpZ/AtpI family protein [Pedobacter sp.]MDQ8052991.1 AtpZ/AtpI family protein [Pedobacter sp.]
MAADQENEGKKQLGNFAKYSAIGFQLLATIGIFAFIGYQIDAHRGSKQPIFTALLGVVGVVGSLVQIIRSLKGKS